MPKFRVRVAWWLADHGIFRERIEWHFKRKMIEWDSK